MNILLYRERHFSHMLEEHKEIVTALDNLIHVVKDDKMEHAHFPKLKKFYILLIYKLENI
jgi:hypothetical protein